MGEASLSPTRNSRAGIRLGDVAPESLVLYAMPVMAAGFGGRDVELILSGHRQTVLAGARLTQHVWPQLVWLSGLSAGL